MTTPEPTPATPTSATVVAEVHEMLDDAKAQATQALAAVEHLDFGAVAAEAKQAVHDAIELAKQRVAALFGHDQPATPEQSSPSA